MNNELQKNYDALKRLHDTTNEAVKRLEKHLAAIMAENAMLKANIENADKRVMIQKQIVIDNLRQTQEEKDDLVKEVMILRQKIKGLKDASVN